MSHSFGEGYATRSDEEGFGGTYGGNQTFQKDNNDKVHENPPGNFTTLYYMYNTSKYLLIDGDCLRLCMYFHFGKITTQLKVAKPRRRRKLGTRRKQFSFCFSI